MTLRMFTVLIQSALVAQVSWLRFNIRAGTVFVPWRPWRSTLPLASCRATRVTRRTRRDSTLRLAWSSMPGRWWLQRSYRIATSEASRGRRWHITTVKNHWLIGRGTSSSY